VIELITSHAEFTKTPFDPSREEDKMTAIDFAVGGQEGEDEIPEAKYGGEAEELPNKGDRS
jgi:hypothetical protein